ncbi:MAG TPA: 50S ribosomal protein L40e [Candidatus Nanoarchaeia archaeon]|nr:50S ribosomal protein L40e [Candidatus Nanoarchaeia archaeon]
MVKFEEARLRKHKDVFVCRKCKSKIKVSSFKVSQGEARCRKCRSSVLRPKRKK